MNVLKSFLFGFMISLGAHLGVAADDHDHGHAHVHGVMHLEVAVDKSHVTIMMTAPADTVFGFEHKPQSAQEKSTEQKVLTILREDLLSLVEFAPSLKCSVQKTHLKMTGDNGGHRDLQGEWRLKCAQPPTGTSLTLKLSKTFPRLEQLRVTLLSDHKQSERKLKRGDGVVKF